MFAKSLVPTIPGPPPFARLAAMPAAALSALHIGRQTPVAAEDCVNLSSKIKTILMYQPMIERDRVPADEFNPFDRCFFHAMNEDLDAIRSKRLFFPKLEDIHLLLCGKKMPQDVTVIENGSGFWPHTAAALLELGCRVMVKEPDAQVYRIHSRQMRQYYGAELESGCFKYAHEMTDVDAPTSADVVYWANPSPSMLDRYGKERLFEYFGRDVMVDGFLVLQSDWPRYDTIEFNANKWEQIVSLYIGEDVLIRGLVMATTQEGGWHSFKVFRRKTL
ncbi:MAG: hypothetical protein WC683_11285 [bacterium]